MSFKQRLLKQKSDAEQAEIRQLALLKKQQSRIEHQRKELNRQYENQLKDFHYQHSSYFRELLSDVKSVYMKKGKLSIKVAKYSLSWSKYRKGFEKDGHRVNLTLTYHGNYEVMTIAIQVGDHSALVDILDKQWQKNLEEKLLELLNSPGSTGWYLSSDTEPSVSGMINY